MSTSSNILVNIIGEFQKKGFDDADKASKRLEKTFKTLGKTLLGVFAAKKIIEFGKASVKAFAEEDRAIKQLNVSLNNLGLGYKGANVEEFIAQTQAASAVADDQLRPALQKLANATLDFGKAQSLLGLALDISASTGKSLEQVTTGLTRAYLKDTQALARLNIGLTQAELKTMSFDEAQRILSERFAGAASAAADSYQGKLNALSIAADEAKEVIGKELVGALQKLADGDFDKVLGAIATSANFVGRAINNIAYGIATIKLFTKQVTDFGLSMEEAKIQADALRREYGKIPKAQVPGKPAGITQRIREQDALNRKLNRDRAAAIRLDKKAAEARIKQAKDEAALKRAGTVFDMENIQIVAALQGRISEDQRLRLTALLAINNKNAEAAEKLSMAVLATNAAAFESIGVIIKAGDNVEDVIRKLINAQANLALVKKGLVEIPKAKNPFEDWPDVMKTILEQIKQITKAVKEVPSLSTNTTTAVGVIPAASSAASTAASLAGTVAGRDSGVIFSPSGTPFVVPSDVGAAAFDDPRMFVDAFSNVLSNPQLNWQAVGDTYVTNVTVNGSVTSDADLVDMITNEIYKAQKSGKGILLNSVAI
jgi:hypothetical protein